MKLKIFLKVIFLNVYIIGILNLIQQFYSSKATSQLELTTSTKAGGKSSIFGSFKAYSENNIKNTKNTNNNSIKLQTLSKDVVGNTGTGPMDRNGYQSQTSPAALDTSKGFSIEDLGFDPTKSKPQRDTTDAQGKYQAELDARASQLNLELDANPIKFQGWVKFFKYPENVKKSANKAFYVNPEFNEEQKIEKNRLEILWTDKLGRSLHVPNKVSFYSTIYDDKLVISKSKDRFLDSKFDVLRFDYMSPVADHEGYAGGIVDFGNFKEGFCFKVKTNQGGLFTWVVCTPTDVEKMMMMRIIKQLKVKTQRTHYTSQTNYARSLMDMKADEQSKIMKEKMDTKYLGADPNNPNAAAQDGKVTVDDEKDGYWIVLQSWSTCTRACGNGTQTLHRMCVPNKTGGKPCDGPAILNRPCNVAPCSSELNLYQGNNTNRTTIAEPQMHVLPFSDRPQRYDKCVLKESDMLMTVDVDSKTMQVEGGSLQSGQMREKIQIPVRVVMNNETISAYSGLEDSDLKATFNLQNSIFQPSLERDYCFVIKEIGLDRSIDKTSAERGYVFKTEFCPFTGSDGGETKNEWDYDFNLFKYQCHQQRDVEPFDVNEIKEQLDKEKGRMRLDILNKKKIKMKLSIPQDESELEKAKTNSIEAIKKENKIEKLIEQEMKEAQKEALERKANELTKEQCKMDALEKAIKQKDIENQFNVKKKQKDDNIRKLKNDVKEEILVKRNKLKEKLKRLKDLSMKQINNMEGQIQNIRLEIAGAMDKANSFNSQLCNTIASKPITEFTKEAQAYCDKKFITDFDNHKECTDIKEPEDFKKFCCDFETPLDKPDEYEKCIGANKVKVDGESPIETRFFWHSKNYLGDFVKPSTIKDAVTDAKVDKKSF